jgi:hypothetical protein
MRLFKEIILGLVAALGFILVILWGSSGPTFMYAMF